jgi:hypothetical protein
MKAEQPVNTPYAVHRGPHPGIVAVVHVALFLSSLLLLVIASKGEAFPNPYKDLQEAQSSLLRYIDIIRINTFLQFGAAIPLGIFTAAVTSRLHFLGVNVTGVSIALFGGIAASVFMTISSLSSWILTQPNIADNINLVHGMQFFSFATGGVGFIVPLGLLMAGVSVPCLFGHYTPKWIAVFGLTIAVIAQLSSFSLLYYPANYLLPVVRLGSFVWMIATGFTLVKNNHQIKYVKV